jgi:hypothetical protein
MRDRTRHGWMLLLAAALLLVAGIILVGGAPW